MTPEPTEMVFPSLPTLDAVWEYGDFAKTAPFRGFFVFGIQHLLRTTEVLFRTVDRAGAGKNILLVGKSYSSHPEVIASLEQRGYKVHVPESDEVERRAYEEVLEHDVHIRLAKIVENLERSQPGRCVLIVDDGGKAIVELHNRHRKYSDQFVCVEQTTRGLRELEGLQLDFPVVNVAGCKAKRLLEGPMIGRSMVRELSAALESWSEVFQVRSRIVLQFGFGAIGENVASGLRKSGFDVRVYEPNYERREKARSLDFSVTELREKTLGEAGIVIGCTGSYVLRAEDYLALQHNTLLVNMASSDIEFPAWRWRKSGQVVATRGKTPDSARRRPWECLYKVIVEGKMLYLANGGFPIDFSGSPDPIPAEEIQLTRGLLLGAMFQAVNERRTGLIELDPRLEEMVVSVMNRHDSP